MAVRIQALVLLITFVLGLALGAYGTYMRMSKADLVATLDVRNDDNEEAKDILDDTLKARRDQSLELIIDKHKQTQVQCPELTNEEIESICLNHYIPTDVMQSFREQVERARGRLN